MISISVYNIGRLLFFSVLLSSCSAVPRGHFVSPTGPGPDYSLEKNWAALPTLKDSADAVPLSQWRDEQAAAAIDVFFIHPTTYTGHRIGQHDWNASMDDEKLNRRTDESTIRYQASLFNGAGRIYAPRYRQAHLHCFYEDQKKVDAADALALAYLDIKSAFEYYLEHYNQGRPFIISAHSQGTLHAAHLIKDEIENSPLQSLLVAAYLPGMPVKADYFKYIQPCRTPDETGCYCTWRTFREGYMPKKYHQPGQNIIVTNPVTWSDSLTFSEKQDQAGAVLRDFYKVVPDLVETQIHEDMLWINKPKFPGSFLFMTKNYHIADYNFFYADVRQNAQQRVKAYLNK